MTTRHRLSPAVLDRLAQVVGEDGGVTAAQIERVLSETAEPIDGVLVEHRSIGGVRDEDVDSTETRPALRRSRHHWRDR